MNSIYVIEDRDYDCRYEIDYVGTEIPFDIFYEYYKDTDCELDIWNSGKLIETIEIRIIERYQNKISKEDYNYLKSLFDKAKEKFDIENNEINRIRQLKEIEREKKELKRLQEKYKDELKTN